MKVTGREGIDLVFTLEGR